jgi:WD40 repeat protein
MGLGIMRNGVLIAAAALVALSGCVGIDRLATKPVFRLETQAHTAKIASVDVDVSGRLLVTASEDKTVRLWSLPEGRLRKVFRVPIGVENEGRLKAVAISPDGSLVATGGHSGSLWDGSPSIYLFDVVKNRMLPRLPVLSGGINHLAFSLNGQFLAATFPGGKGVRVWRSGDWREVMNDDEYGDDCDWADFSRDGRLVTTSKLGYLRLYDETFRLIAKVRAPGGKPLRAAAFSPDGTRVAVGYADAARVDVFSARDLSILFSPDVSEVYNGGLSAVAWSFDGKFLYAGGSWVFQRKNPIIRWSDGGRGDFDNLSAGRNDVSAIVTNPGGGIIYGAGDSTFGVIDVEGRGDLRPVSAVSDLSRDEMGLRSSRDGSHVAFLFQRRDRPIGRFSVFDRRMTFGGSSKIPFNISPHYARGLFVRGSRTPRPSVNGRRLYLDRDETSRSLAVAKDGSVFLLGTTRFIRSYNRFGFEKWKVPTPGFNTAVNLAKIRKMVVAAFEDGTIRWYRMTDGKEILVFFPHRNGKDWVAWTPDGYYMASPNGDDQIGWHINNGRDTAPDFYKARQFERILHRPDYVLAYFKHLGDAEKARAEVGGEFFDVKKLRSIAPPRIEIAEPGNWSKVAGDSMKVRFRVDKRSLPMRDYAVFVNGIPVTPSGERRLGAGEGDSFGREVQVPLFADENEIRVEVFNGTSMGVAETSVVRTGTAASPPPGDLYLLSVGASRFPGVPGADLDYAALDADAMAKVFQGKNKSPFGKVHVKTVSDNAALKPTRATILEALSFIKQATARDTVIVFLASHGMSDRRGTYYFVPADASHTDVKTVLADTPSRALTPGTSSAPTLITWQSFFEALRGTAGRRLLIVDTCQAKNIAGTLDIHSLAKRSASANFALMAASSGTEDSQEYPPAKHGRFTHALLQGLSGKADTNTDNKVTLNELFTYTSKFVQSNRLAKSHPQTPHLTAPGMLGDMVLSVN